MNETAVHCAATTVCSEGTTDRFDVRDTSYFMWTEMESTAGRHRVDVDTQGGEHLETSQTAKVWTVHKTPKRYHKNRCYGQKW